MSKFFVKNYEHSIEVQLVSDKNKISDYSTVFFASDDENKELFKQYNWYKMTENEVVKKLHELNILKEKNLTYDGFFPNLKKEHPLYNEKIDNSYIGWDNKQLDKTKRHHYININNIDTTTPYFNAMVNFVSGSCSKDEANKYFNSIGFKFDEIYEDFKNQKHSFSTGEFKNYYDALFREDVLRVVDKEAFIDFIKKDKIRRKDEVSEILTNKEFRSLLTDKETFGLRENIYVMGDLSKPYIECELNKNGVALFSDENYEDFNHECYHFITKSEYELLYKIYCLENYSTNWNEISSESYYEQLNVLPPKRWETVEEVEFFQSSERQIGNITSTFANYDDKFYKSFQTTKVDYEKLSKEIIKKREDSKEDSLKKILKQYDDSQNDTATLVVVNSKEDIQKRLSESVFNNLDIKENEDKTIIKHPVKIISKYGYDNSYELNSLIEKNRTFEDALKNLGLTNDSEIDLKSDFENTYKNFLDTHKESDYKYLKNQKDVDNSVMSKVMQKNNLSKCDYSKSIVEEVDILGNGYSKRKTNKQR